MMRIFLAAPLSLIVLTSTFAIANENAPHPIVGQWEWTNKNCVEKYTYRKDGTALVESGEDRNEDKYEISGTPEGNNRHRLKVTTVRDSAGKDCSGSVSDSTGESATVFVEFGSSYTQMLVCLDANSYKCFGPLRRVAR
jgi:hypothetical protein